MNDITECLNANNKSRKILRLYYVGDISLNINKSLNIS